MTRRDWAALSDVEVVTTTGLADLIEAARDFDQVRLNRLLKSKTRTQLAAALYAAAHLIDPDRPVSELTAWMHEEDVTDISPATQPPSGLPVAVMARDLRDEHGTKEAVAFLRGLDWQTFEIAACLGITTRSVIRASTYEAA